MSHTITEEELADYVEGARQNWTQFACSSDAGSLKRLDFCIRHVAPVYRVTFQRGADQERTTVYVGALKETAVREYNALPPT